MPPPHNLSSQLCSIASGNAAGKFAVNTGTGVITVDASLDYETTTSYELVLNCAGNLFKLVFLTKYIPQQSNQILLH